MLYLHHWTRPPHQNIHFSQLNPWIGIYLKGEIKFVNYLYYEKILNFYTLQPHILPASHTTCGAKTFILALFTHIQIHKRNTHYSNGGWTYSEPNKYFECPRHCQCIWGIGNQINHTKSKDIMMCHMKNGRRDVSLYRAQLIMDNSIIIPRYSS